MVCFILLTENYPKDIIYESMNYKGKRMEIDKIQMYERELEIIDNMNGHEFEKFCAKLLENCEFVGCTHIKEENCGIKQALQQGKIDNGRYERFCKIYEELKEKERYKW